MADNGKARKKTVRATWERGYYAHNYWNGRNKVGTVKLAPKAEWDGVYRWEAGSHTGESKTLDAAKRAVEQAVDFGASQMGLF